MIQKLFKASPAIVAFFGAVSIASLLAYHILNDSLERPVWVIALQWLALVAVLALFSVYSLLASQPLRGQYIKAVAVGGLFGILASTQFPSDEFSANFALVSIGLATAYTMSIMVVGLRRLTNIEK